MGDNTKRFQDHPLKPLGEIVFTRICHICISKYLKKGQNYVRKGRIGTLDAGDIDLCPSEPSINRGSLLPKMDLRTKFEKCRSRFSRDIDRKRF